MKLGSHKKDWTTNEEAELRSLYRANIPILELAEKFGRTCGAIQQRLKKLHISKYPNWSTPELEKLHRLIGTAPKRILIKKYQEWASYHGYPERTQQAIWHQVRIAPVSRRLHRRYDWYSTTDVANALGCTRDTACDWFVKYQKVLEPVPVEEIPTGGNMVSRKRLRRFLIENPQIVNRYRATIELYWYTDLLANR
ncbi:MAG: hypothetical protein ACRCZS_23795 [Chroococcidiopsis sp.]